MTWDSPQDPQSPFNWPLRTKWMVTLFVSFGGFISMMAPALPAISNDLAMTEEDASLALSIFTLAFAVGPMALAPFAEAYGRRPVWVTAGLFYTVWNVVCGFSQNRGTLIAARFLSSIGGAVDFVITSPVVKDVWPAEQRGCSFSIVYFVPLLGPALGPMVGGAITQHIGWRWLFWLSAIINTALVALCGVFFPETSGAMILDLKAKRLTRETGEIHYTEADLDKDGTKQVGARKSIINRLKMSIGDAVVRHAAYPAVHRCPDRVQLRAGVLHALHVLVHLHRDLRAVDRGQRGPLHCHCAEIHGRQLWGQPRHGLVRGQVFSQRICRVAVVPHASRIRLSPIRPGHGCQAGLGLGKYGSRTDGDPARCGQPGCVVGLGRQDAGKGEASMVILVQGHDYYKVTKLHCLSMQDNQKCCMWGVETSNSHHHHF